MKNFLLKILRSIPFIDIARTLKNRAQSFWASKRLWPKKFKMAIAGIHPNANPLEDYRSIVTDAPLQKNARAPITIKVAGHDMKFAEFLFRDLPYETIFEKWLGHQTPPQTSLKQKKAEDIIFCEWALGNAIHYSKTCSKEQCLIIRFHAQELYSQLPYYIEVENVDVIIFVAEHTRQSAVRKYHWPVEKTIVIPNYIPPEYKHLSTRKKHSAREIQATSTTIGMVGIVPRLKRLDLALDLLSLLSKKRPGTFQLAIKGKKPSQYEWLKNRPEELKYFKEQMNRIEKDPLLKRHVNFVNENVPMTDYYSDIDYIVSFSDRESFHMALAEGIAAGAKPLVLRREGVLDIYRDIPIYADTAELAAVIQKDSVPAYTLPPELDPGSVKDYYRKVFKLAFSKI